MVHVVALEVVTVNFVVAVVAVAAVLVVVSSSWCCI